jgi:hypothetical protein
MLLAEAVAVWTSDQGVPERLVWGSQRYRVTDEPTSLEIDYATITHPPVDFFGWRFQGTSDVGETRIFDVRFDSDCRQWRLLRTYV